MQLAVDSASSGDSILIAAGTYEEQVVIREKNLNVVGESGTILKAPGAMTTTLAPSTTRRVILGVVYSQVNVSGVNFEGNESGAANGRLTGVYYVGSNGSVSNCAFQGFRGVSRVSFREAAYVAANPVASGMALTHVEVHNSRFSDNEDSILIIGDELAAPRDLRQTFVVEGNRISGVGFGTNGYQFGVRIHVGASGVVRGNTISDYLASGSIPSLSLVIGSAGILAFDTASVGSRPPWATEPLVVQGNMLTNNIGGVDLFVSNESRVSDNQIDGAGGATGVANEGGICISGTNVTVVGNRISNNSIGINLLASSIFGTARDTVLINNVMRDATTPINEQPGVTGTTYPMPPVIITPPIDQAVALGAAANFFSLSVTGSAPLSYQWQHAGTDLPDGTNRTLTLRNVQLTNGGIYTVRVTNLAGAITSSPAQLSVAAGRVYTNGQGARLPYRLFTPDNYDASKKYPLVVFWHGSGAVGTDNLSQLSDGMGGQFIFLSATNRAKYPCFFVAPQIPSATAECTANLAVIDQGAELINLLTQEFSIDPDRRYVTGLSHGAYYTWIFAARHANLVAAIVPMSGGWLCHTNFLNITMPVWNFHAANDATVTIGNSDAAVSALRNAGGNPIYTRFQGGGHAIWPKAYATPRLVDWLMAQRRGVASTAQPLLNITSPTTNSIFVTTSPALDLGGIARDINVMRLTWTNTANRAAGEVTGTNAWSVAGIPLRAGATNVIVVTGRATSYSPDLSLPEDTTFNQTIRVVQAGFPLGNVNASPDRQSISFSWNAQPAKRYQVQYKNDLNELVWINLPTIPTIDGSSASVMDVIGEKSRKFYRVVESD
jgi:poly(3-hydroxybutyrate) depolymerase